MSHPVLAFTTLEITAEEVKKMHIVKVHNDDKRYCWRVVEYNSINKLRPGIVCATFWLQSDAEAFVHAMELDRLFRLDYFYS